MYEFRTGGLCWAFYVSGGILAALLLMMCMAAEPEYIPLLIFGAIFCAAGCIISRIINPFVRQSDYLIDEKAVKSEITFYDDVTFLPLRFKDDEIFTFVFTDDNDTPVTDVIPMRVSNIYRYGRRYTCTMSFLPERKDSILITESIKFYVYDDKKQIGEGYTCIFLTLRETDEPLPESM